MMILKSCKIIACSDNFDFFLDGCTIDISALTIPVISIIVEGGINSMKTVWQAVMRGIPVLVLQSSGRAADFIAHGYNITANKLR